MIVTGYPLRYTGKAVSINDDTLLFTHRYTFKTRFNKHYIVNVEQYKYNLYILKFHLKEHRNSKNKYGFIINDHDCFRIMSTCINVLLKIKNKNSKASFGFMGHPKTDETLVNTTRFRIYKRRATDYFSKDNYIHAQNVKGSAYLLINRNNKEPDIKNKIEKMIYKYWNTD